MRSKFFISIFFLVYFILLFILLFFFFIIIIIILLLFFFGGGGGGGGRLKLLFFGLEIFVDIYWGALLFLTGYFYNQLLLFVFCDEIYTTIKHDGKGI